MIARLVTYIVYVYDMKLLILHLFQTGSSTVEWAKDGRVNGSTGNPADWLSSIEIGPRWDWKMKTEEMAPKRDFFYHNLESNFFLTPKSERGNSGPLFQFHFHFLFSQKPPILCWRSLIKWRFCSESRSFMPLLKEEWTKTDKRRRKENRLSLKSCPWINWNKEHAH